MVESVFASEGAPSLDFASLASAPPSVVPPEPPEPASSEPAFPPAPRVLVVEPPVPDAPPLPEAPTDDPALPVVVEPAAPPVAGIEWKVSSPPHPIASASALVPIKPKEKSFIGEFTITTPLGFRERFLQEERKILV